MIFLLESKKYIQWKKIIKSHTKKKQPNKQAKKKTSISL